jgi:diketogulonate reductase-like aldo/keto reductase
MIVKAWGDWSLFQELLGVLRSVGDRHGDASIANIATRWVLDHACVGAVIIGKRDRICCAFPAFILCGSSGTRLGITDHAEDNQKVMELSLDDADREAIEAVLDRSNGRRLITTIGDCGAEYR